MNSFMGVRDSKLGPIPPMAGNFKLFFAKDSELTRPDALWVLLDEDERSIHTGFFVTDPTAGMWYNFPAISSHRHDYSFALNFADGHSEVWRHRDPRTFDVTVTPTEQSGNTDLNRLAQMTTIRNQ
jgi:hypothetical protein